MRLLISVFNKWIIFSISGWNPLDNDFPQTCQEKHEKDLAGELTTAACITCCDDSSWTNSGLCTSAKVHRNSRPAKSDVKTHGNERIVLYLRYFWYFFPLSIWQQLSWAMNYFSSSKPCLVYWLGLASYAASQIFSSLPWCPGFG